MTISGIVLSLFANGKAQARPPATTPADTDAVRRCALYRNCFPSMDVAYPALVVRDHTVAKWVRAHDVAVHVRTSEELGAVISAGVHPARLTVHADGVLTNELVFCAASLAVGHIVVNSVDQIEILTRAIGRQRRQAVLVRIVDTAANGESYAAIRAVLAGARLSLIGLHADIGSAAEDFVSYPAAVGDLICTMHRFRQSHGRVLTRLSLGGVPAPADDWVAELSRQAAVIDQSLDNACLTVDFPRPTVTMSAFTVASGKRAA